MKKLAALLISVLVMSFPLTATASSIEGFTGTSHNDNLKLASTNVVEVMPCFRAGDLLSFEITDLTKDDSVTLISSKVSANGVYADNVVQYINQYDFVGETQEIKFKIRDNQEGIYELKITDRNGSINFYYMVATPVFGTMKGGTQAEPTNYRVIGDRYVVGHQGRHNIGFVGTVEVGTDEVSLAQAGIENIGFTITIDGITKTHSLISDDADADNTEETSFLATIGNIEAQKVIYNYGFEMTHVPETKLDDIEVEAVEIDAEGNVVSSTSQAE